MENSSKLFELIFNKGREDADTKSYLENIAAEHPYFSPAQFYLLLQTKKDDPSYSSQVQKTSALFNNNYWLNYLISSSGETSNIFTGAKQNETIADDSDTIFVNDTVAPEAIEKVELPVSSNEEPKIGVITGESITTEMAAAEIKAFDESAAVTVKESVHEETVTEEAVDAEPVIEAVVQPAAELHQPSPALNTEPVKTDEQHSSSNNTPLQDINASAEPLLFQPLHTSDYFASVGIKLSEETNANDRLGKQLKSFTQWLKTMKKIDTAQPEIFTVETTGETATQNIQTLAEKSNKEDEVITEAMADVLVQQGRINKAVEVLKKLSLLNPSKSTYFAAKIEQLKD